MSAKKRYDVWSGGVRQARYTTLSQALHAVKNVAWSNCEYETAIRNAEPASALHP